MNKGDFRAFTKPRDRRTIRPGRPGFLLASISPATAGLRHFDLAYGVPGDFGKVMAFLAII